MGGFYNGSMDEIAAGAGVSKPMLYAYFESKEGLYAAYVERTGGELLSRLQASADAQDPPIERLRARTREFLAFVEEHRDGWTVLFRELAASGRRSAMITGGRADDRGRSRGPISKPSPT